MGNAVDATEDLGSRAQRRLIGENQIGDRQRIRCTKRQQFRGTTVGVRDRRLHITLMRARAFALAENETATDRIPSLFRQHLAIAVERSKYHCVRMARQSALKVEDDVLFGIEGNDVPVGKRKPTVLLDIDETPLGIGGIDCLWQAAVKAEQHRLLGRVALSGPGQRPEQRHLNARDRYGMVLGQRPPKAACRLHRSRCM